MTDDAPAHGPVLGVDVGFGGRDPRRREGIDLIRRRHAHGRAAVEERKLVFAPADEADEFAVEKITLPDRGVARGLVPRARGVGVEFVETALRSDHGHGGVGHPLVGPIVEEQRGAIGPGNMRRGEALDTGAGRRRAIGQRAAEVVDRGVIGVSQRGGIVGVGVEVGRVGEPLVTAGERGALEVAVNPRDRVLAEMAEQAGFLREIQGGVGGRAESLAAVVGEIVADGIGGEIRPAEVGVDRAVHEPALHIDVDRRRVEADDAGVGAILFLLVVGDFEAERVFEKRLAEARVEGVELGGLTLVGAVEQRVVEIEDRRIADLLVFPKPGVSLAGGRELLVEEEERVVALRRVVADAEPLGERIAAAAEHERRRAGAAHHGGVGIREDAADLAEPTAGRAQMRREQRIGGHRRGLARIDGDLVQHVEPNRESVLRRRGPGAVGRDFPGLIAYVELRERVAKQARLPAQRRIEPAVVFEGGLLAKLLVVVQADDAHRQPVLHDGLVQIEHLAVRIVAAIGLLKDQGIFAQIRDFQLVVDDARRATEAEKDGIGPA